MESKQQLPSDGGSVGIREDVAATHEEEDALARQHKVLIGTCGWTDPTLVQSKRFFPPNVKTAVDMLTYYSKHFPAVEIDTSTYAIPRESAVKQWIAAVPDGFVFNIKAYGLFASQAIESTALPVAFRDIVEASGKRIAKGIRLFLKDLPQAVVDGVWARYNHILTMLHEAGKLGCVMFQFNLGFRPSPASFEYILECKRRLKHGQMVVEFRNREWFSSTWLGQDVDVAGVQAGEGSTISHPDDHKEENLYKTLPFCRRNGIPIAACDDLKHELELATAEERAKVTHRIRMPIHAFITHPALFYVRVHRREGNNRLLTEEEIQDWADILCRVMPHINGPAYFHFGTYWEDHPIRNIRALAEALPACHTYKWKEVAKQRRFAKGLGRFFGSQAMSGKAAAPSVSKASGAPSTTSQPQQQRVCPPPTTHEGLAPNKRQRVPGAMPPVPSLPATSREGKGPSMVKAQGPVARPAARGKPTPSGQKALTSFFQLNKG